MNVEALLQRLSALEQKSTEQALEIAALHNSVAQLAKKKQEGYYQKLLENVLRAKHMCIPGIGTTDLTTEDAHIEIKIWTDYKKVPGQLAAYQQGCPRQKSIVYFFGKLPDRRKLEHIKMLMISFRIQMFSIDDNNVITEHTPEHRDQALLQNDPFVQFLNVAAERKIGEETHVHKVKEVYQSWLAKEKRTVTDKISTQKTSKWLTNLGWSLGPNTRLSSCTGNCIKKRQRGATVQNMVILELVNVTSNDPKQSRDSSSSR